MITALAYWGTHLPSHIERMNEMSRTKAVEAAPQPASEQRFWREHNHLMQLLEGEREHHNLFGRRTEFKHGDFKGSGVITGADVAIARVLVELDVTGVTIAVWPSSLDVRYH